MPQMSPISWSFIIIFMIYITLMLNSNMNRINMMTKKNSNFSKNTKKMMW